MAQRDVKFISIWGEWRGRDGIDGEQRLGERERQGSGDQEEVKSEVKSDHESGEQSIRDERLGEKNEAF